MSSPLSSSDAGEREAACATTSPREQYWIRATTAFSATTSPVEPAPPVARGPIEKRRSRSPSPTLDFEPSRSPSFPPAPARIDPSAFKRLYDGHSPEPDADAMVLDADLDDGEPRVPIEFNSDHSLSDMELETASAMPAPRIASPSPSPDPLAMSPLSSAPVRVSPARLPTSSPLSPPAASSSSPPPAPSPSPSPSPIPEPVPAPEPAGRTFRKRTTAQLQPYTIEQTKYTRTLVRNGWQGAVVAGFARGGDLSADEMRRRKAAAESAPKDDLGGWLEYSQGQAVGRERELERDLEGDDDEVDGETLLEREAMRKERMRRDVERAFGGRKRAKSQHSDSDSDSRADRGPVSHRHEKDQERTGNRTGKLSSVVKGKRRADSHVGRSGSGSGKSRQRASSDADLPSGKFASRPSTSHRGSTSKDGHSTSSKPGPSKPGPFKSGPPKASSTSHCANPHSISHRPSDADTDSDSRPRASSLPASQPRPKRRKKARESALAGPSDVHSHRRSNHDSLDEQLLALPTPSRRTATSAPIDLTLSDAASSSASDSSNEDEDEAEKRSPTPELPATKLEGKRRLALSRMMPGVFFKKAQRDLELMQQEAEHGNVDVYDRGSGDEDERPGRARVRFSPGRETRFDGEQFTDESSSDGQEVGDDDEGPDVVSSWLDDFAPRRGGGGGGRTAEDVAIARLLRRPAISSKSKPRPKQKKLQDATLVPRAPKPAKAPLREIRLDTAAAIFDRATLDAFDLELDDVENRDPRTKATAGKSSERWASFSKFSPDFEIAHLPPGVRLHPKSFVTRGHLHSLLHPTPVPAPHRRCRPFGIQLDSTMSREEIDDVLPQLCDAVHDALDDPDDETGATMRFLGAFVSDFASRWDAADARAFAAGLEAQVDRLDRRLEAQDSRESQKVRRISLAWYEVDLAVRLRAKPFGCDAGDERCEERVGKLVERLVLYGVDHTMKSLKEVSKLEAPEDADQDVRRVVDDPSVEAWLGLISLALRPADSWAFGEAELWALVLQSVDALGLRSPAAGEVAAYTAMTLCAVSQFSSSSGLSSSSPRLHAYWPAIFRALDPIQPEVVALDSSLSNTAVARRDRYLWTQFARCLLLVDRWSWTLDAKSEVLAKLAAIINARHLANLSIERSPDFPSFLPALIAGDPIPSFEKGDTTFHLFLKLVSRAAASTSGKALTRMLVRVSPTSAGGWTRTSPEVERGESVLVNHYSLLLTLAALNPAAASSRLEQARRLVAFAEVDKHARIATVRAILLFSDVLRKTGISIDRVIDWLADAAGQLRIEYGELDQRSRTDGTKKQGKRATSPLEERALLLVIILRSVGKILQWKPETGTTAAYPDLGLVHPAWTSQLLDSPLALDPVAGSSILATLSHFFSARALALHPPVELSDSQDEFGHFDFDADDPALNAMLGVDVGAARAELETKERAFADVVHTRLVPALYRLLTRIYASDEQMGDRSAFAATVVQCWADGIAVLVSHGISEWAPFLQYGNQSWRRISDLVGRRDVGLLLAIQILSHDPSIFPTYQDEFLDIWVQSLVARTLSAQHMLLSTLLRLDHVPSLLSDMPFERTVDISLSNFKEHRVEVLHALFRNSGKLLRQGPATQTQGGLVKSTVTNLLRSVFAAMKDNLSSDSDQQSRTAYAAFVRDVLEGVGACGPTVTGPTVPDLQWLKSQA